MAHSTSEDLSQVELELKFDVPPAAVDVLAADLRKAHAKVQRLQAIYFDTSDDRLAARRVVVRLRKEGRRWMQTAKASTGDAFRRLEHNAPVTTPRGGAEPALDLSRHDGTEVGAAIREALGSAAAQSDRPVLVERFRIDVSRLHCIERIGESSVELALDTGSIRAGKRSTPVCEFEMELKSGSAADLCALAMVRAARDGLWLSVLSKSARGERLLRGRAAASSARIVKATVPSIDADAGPAGFVVAVLDSCLAQIIGNASEVAAGHSGEEVVHQLRIGLRRMRTALAALSGFATGIDPAWANVLARAFRELGAHRDTAVVVPSVLAQMAADGVMCAWAPVPPPVLRSPGAVVRDAAFQRTLLAMLAFCHSPAVPPKALRDTPKHLRKRLARRLDTLHARLARDAKQFADLSEAQQHAVRKRLKRLRYLCEFATPVFGVDAVEGYLQGWRKAQDAIGLCNDQRIALQALRAGARGEPGTLEAQAWLLAQIEEGVARSAKRLRKAARRPVLADSLFH